MLVSYWWCQIYPYDLWHLAGPILYSLPMSTRYQLKSAAKECNFFKTTNTGLRKIRLGVPSRHNSILQPKNCPNYRKIFSQICYFFIKEKNSPFIRKFVDTMAKVLFFFLGKALWNQIFLYLVGEIMNIKLIWISGALEGIVNTKKKSNELQVAHLEKWW